MELVYSEVAIGDNHSTACDSSPYTALPNTEISYDKCIDISDMDNKCNALVNFNGLVTIGDNENNGRPHGQVNMVAANPEKCNEVGNALTDTVDKNCEVKVGPLQVQTFGERFSTIY